MFRKALILHSNKGFSFKSKRRVEKDPYYKLEITKDWSIPTSIEYGKDIVIKLSEEYFLVSVQITGCDDKRFERSILVGSENIIHANAISHIRNPVISFKTEFEGNVSVEIELRQPNYK